ncbi:MAG: Ca-activated chloride channel family protein [Myxococcota bacterium]|jgi:Ca-activated chloride channel family protein
MHRTLLLAIAIALALAPQLASAQGLVTRASRTDAPETLHPLQRFDVQATLTDHEGQVVEQRRYSVFDGTAVTARFYRPLRAEVTPVSLQIGAIEHGFEILNATDANALRLELADTFRDPVFVRDWGQAMLVSAPIVVPGPYEPPIEITLTTDQSLAARGTMRGISVPVDWHRAPTGPVSVTVNAETDEPLRAVYSPYHELSTERDDDHRVSGAYSGYGRCTAFEVTILLSTGDAPVHLDLLPYRDADSDGTLLALLSTPLSGAEQGGARDIVIVIDRSGSMSGEKMVQAKAALQSVLEGLGAADRFGIVAFDTSVDALGDSVREADSSGRADGAAFVSDLNADGGTNIHDALQTAFSAFPTQSGRPRYVVFLTDGQATEGITDTDAILDMARSHNEIGARIFTFGIGDQVNTALLDTLASDSAGVASYIRPGQAVDVVVAAFFEQIADPVVSNPVLDLTGIGGHLAYPAVLSDLFAGRTTTIAARFDAISGGTVSLEGVFAGQPIEFVFDVVLPGWEDSTGFAPRLWARRRVADLLQQIKLGDTDPALVDEAMALADRYGVVTNFTFFSPDEAGNMLMTWGGVSSEQVGSTAVETSTSISSYATGGGVGDTIDAYVRYHADRTFPTRDGRFTDTALPASSAWVDLHFMSPAWVALLKAEADQGIAGFLSVGAEARFQFVDRKFRVTDPTTETELPTASTNIPQASTASNGPTRADWQDPDFVGATPAPGPGTQVTGTQVAGTQVAGTQVAGTTVLTAGTPTGCTQSHQSSGTPATMLLTLLLLLALATTRLAARTE